MGNLSSIPVALTVLALLATTRPARADGGALLLWDRAGIYQVAVFTSPTPLQAGPVDVSVLVQDAKGLPVPDARVEVRLTTGEQRLAAPATFDLATNKLFRAAHFDLPAGHWDVEVEVAGPAGARAVRGAIDVAAARTPAGALWPWYCWPALAVALFVAHQVLARRR